MSGTHVRQLKILFQCVYWKRCFLYSLPINWYRWVCESHRVTADHLHLSLHVHVHEYALLLYAVTGCSLIQSTLETRVDLNLDLNRTNMTLVRSRD